MKLFHNMIEHLDTPCIKAIYYDRYDWRQLEIDVKNDRKQHVFAVYVDVRVAYWCSVT